MSEIKKQYYNENPEARQQMSERVKKFFEENPEAGKEHSEKIKKNYEDNPELKKKILDSKGKNKPFDVFTKDGAFIHTFDYQYEAKEYLQKNYNTSSTIKIGQVLKGSRNYSSGFVFKYK
jgi:hypothetical protein